MKLCQVSENLRTHECCLEAVQKNPQELRFVPKNFFRNTSFCYQLVNSIKEEDVNVLKFIPNELRTIEFCTAAINKSKHIFYYIPKEIISEVCLDFIRYDASNLQYIPDEFKTSDFYLAAIRNGITYWGGKEWNDVVLHLPCHLKTFAFYVASMQPRGLASTNKESTCLSWTPKICLDVVQEDSLALGFMPESFKTLEVCLAAIQNCCTAIEFIPQSFLRSQEFCQDAAKLITMGENAEIILSKYMTPELWNSLIEQGRWSFSREDSFIPSAVREIPECCLVAVKHNARALEFFPNTLKTREICLAAIKKSPFAIQDVPFSLLTDEFLNAAVQNIPADAHEYTECRLRQEFDNAVLRMEHNGLGEIYDYAFDDAGFRD